MYTILIDYQTGNSFNTFTETQTIGYSFDTIEKARLVLRYIKEQYRMYCEMKEWRPFSKRKGSSLEKDVINKYKDHPWFNSEYPTHSIKYLDRFIDSFWLGYFEILNSAKIVLDDINDDEDQFTGYSVRQSV